MLEADERQWLKQIAQNTAAALGKLDTLIAENPTTESNAAAIISLVTKILAALTKQTDIVNLGGLISKPINQQGDSRMAVTKLGQVALTQNLYDDQQCTITLAPTNAQGVAESFPSGSLPSYSIAPGTAGTITPDPTGVTCAYVGKKGVAGTEVVTASYTNPDGTVAEPSTFTFVQTIDPAEGDIANLGGSISTPIAQ